MWQQKHPLSVCIWFQYRANLCPLSPYPRCPLAYPHLSLYDYFSISVQFFSRVAPQFFYQHDSPSNLAESRYPRRRRFRASLLLHNTCNRSWCTWLAVWRQNKKQKVCTRWLWSLVPAKMKHVKKQVLKNKKSVLGGCEAWYRKNEIYKETTAVSGGCC